MDRLEDIDRVIGNVATAETVGQVLEALRAEVDRFGFEWFTYEMIVPADGPLCMFSASTFPIEWLDRYAERR